MNPVKAWTQINDRSRLYAASAAIHVAIGILRLCHRLYRRRILDLETMKSWIRLSDKFRRASWLLLKRKH